MSEGWRCGGGIARPVFALPVIALFGATLTGWAYWPGLMSWDPVRQYDEALRGEITDWHPPIMQWVWRQMLALDPGPAAMLLLQLALYWGGLTLLAGMLWTRGRRGLAFAVMGCGFCPLGLALSGMILKDSMMAGALLVATGLLAVCQLRRGAVRTLAAIGGGGMLLFAAMLRFNAFTACLPLLVALMPERWRRGRARLLGATAIATVTLLAAMPVANRLIGAEPSGVALSLVIFDLGGITEHSGTNAFPGQLGVRDAVRVNHRCYRPNKWDSYSDWVDPECPLGLTAWNAKVDSTKISAYRLWAGAIAAHPIAYALHRLTHFAINSRILPLSDAVERPVPFKDAPNDWGFRITPNPAMRAIDSATLAMAHGPLGWPIVWIALAFGAVVASWDADRERLILPIALSSIFYGFGYLLFSVAAELRYHLWTLLAALIAAVLAMGDAHVRRGRRLLWLFAPAVIAALVGAAARTV